MQGKSVLKALTFIFRFYCADTLDKQHESSSASCWIAHERQRNIEDPNTSTYVYQHPLMLHRNDPKVESNLVGG